MPDARIVDFGNDLLDGLVTGLTTAGITVPEHRYLHSGDFAADLTPENCGDALIVSFAGLAEGTGLTSGVGTPIKCAVPLLARFTIALLRCVPSMDESGTPPAAADLQASAEELLYDAMELANVVIDLYLGNTCSMKRLGALLPLGPLGGVGGHTLDVLTELE